MCESHAYVYQNGKENLILESVGLIEPQEDGKFLLKSIFGEQKIIQGKIKLTNPSAVTFNYLKNNAKIETHADKRYFGGII